MESPMISKALFYLDSIQYRIGRLSMLGILLIMIAAIAYFGICLPRLNRLHSLETQTTKLSAHPALAEKITIPTVALNAETFLKQFPNGTEKDDALKTIIALAEKNKLPLMTGKYETLTKESRALVFYQINLPLKGSYPQIRQFLADTLNTLPNASITALQIHHGIADSNQIDADVSFTLYFNKTA